jgi:tRNA A-37 threonylcarbamoyl transferase component Bud32
MRSDDLLRLESLLGELLELEPAERAGRVTALRAADDPLAPLVERLLARHDADDGALAAPVGNGARVHGIDEWVDPLVGARLGDFTLERLVGVGAAGRVYEATQAGVRRRVAVKVLAPRRLSGEMDALRFRREAAILGALDHPGICRVIAAGMAPYCGDELPYLAMEYVEGEPLDLAAARLSSDGRIELIAKVADAIAAAHAAGVLHRDLKPGNVLVVQPSPGGEPHPKLLDFGVAALLDGARDPAEIRTGAGELLGTLAYLSPERIAGGRGDARSEVFALGVMLFQVLTGRRPFAAEDGLGLAEAARAASGSAPRVSAFVRGLGEDLDAVVAKALAREPDRRYQCAAELAAELRRVNAGERVEVRRGASIRGFLRRRPRAGFALLAVVSACSAYAAFASWTRDDVDAPTVGAQRAYAALRDGDPDAARAALELVPTADRSFEWRLVHHAVQRRGAAEGGEPRSLARRMAKAGTVLWHPFEDLGRFDEASGRFEVLDLHDGAVLAEIADLPLCPHRFALSADGRHLVLAGLLPRSTLAIRDARTGETLAEQHDLREDDHAFALAPDGASLVIAGATGRIRRFAVPTLEPLWEIRAGGRVECLAIDPQGSRVAATVRGRGLLVFALGSGDLIASCMAPEGLPIYPFFSDDGRQLAALNWGSPDLRLWDAGSGESVRSVPVAGNPMSMVVLRGSGCLAVGTQDGRVHVYGFTAASGPAWLPRLTLRETDAVVHMLAAPRKGTALFGWTDEAEALIWNAPR